MLVTPTSDYGVVTATVLWLLVLKLTKILNRDGWGQVSFTFLSVTFLSLE